jgi:hypothetical protein
VLLQASADRALDARYAMRNKELWAVVVHPLATLATDDLPSMFDQVVMLVKNTGTTYASSDLIFGVSEDERLDLEYEGEDEGEGSEDDDEAELSEIAPHDDDEEGDFDDFEGDDEDEDEDESGWRKGGTGFSP